MTEAFHSPKQSVGFEEQKGTWDGEEARLEFQKAKRSTQLARGETILEAAERLGVNISYECRSGVCGQCKIKCHKGTLRMDNTDALSKQERSEGWILACQAHATSPEVVIEA